MGIFEEDFGKLEDYKWAVAAYRGKVPHMEKDSYYNYYSRVERDMLGMMDIADSFHISLRNYSLLWH